MFEDHNGDRLAAPVVEPHAVSPYILGHLPDESLDRTLPVRILRVSAPGKRETAILNDLVGEYWMLALLANLREWRQKGGEHPSGNKRIHGNFHDFCVVSSGALVNGRKLYLWYLVKTRLGVHNLLLDDMNDHQPCLSIRPRPIYSEIGFDCSQYRLARPRCTYMSAPCMQYARAQCLGITGCNNEGKALASSVLY